MRFIISPGIRVHHQPRHQGSPHQGSPSAQASGFTISPGIRVHHQPRHQGSPHQGSPSAQASGFTIQPRPRGIVDIDTSPPLLACLGQSSSSLAAWLPHLFTAPATAGLAGLPPHRPSPPHTRTHLHLWLLAGPPLQCCCHGVWPPLLLHAARAQLRLLELLQEDLRPPKDWFTGPRWPERRGEGARSGGGGQRGRGAEGKGARRGGGRVGGAGRGGSSDPPLPS